MGLADDLAGQSGNVKHEKPESRVKNQGISFFTEIFNLPMNKPVSVSSKSASSKKQYVHESHHHHVYHRRDHSPRSSPSSTGSAPQEEPRLR
jgi:hypothetical protein